MIEKYDSAININAYINAFIKDKQQTEFTSDEKIKIDSVLNDFFKNKNVDWERNVVFETDDNKQLKTIDNYYYGKTVKLIKYNDMFIYQTIHDDFESDLLITNELDKVINELDINFYYDLECIGLQH